MTWIPKYFVFVGLILTRNENSFFILHSFGLTCQMGKDNLQMFGKQSTLGGFKFKFHLPSCTFRIQVIDSIRIRSPPVAPHFSISNQPKASTTKPDSKQVSNEPKKQANQTHSAWDPILHEVVMQAFAVFQIKRPCYCEEMNQRTNFILMNHQFGTQPI